MRKLVIAGLVALGVGVLAIPQIGAITALYNTTVRIVDSAGNVLGGVASATTANYNSTVRVVDSTGHVLDSLTSGTISTPVQIGNVIYAQTGSDLGAALNTCIAASLTQNSSGGICDATALHSGTISTPVIVSKGVKLIMGAGTFTCNTGAASDCFTVYETAQLQGQGHISQAWGSPMTKITSTNGVAVSSLVHAISQSGSSQWWHEGEISYLTLEGNNGNTGATNGILIDRCGEVARVHDLWIHAANTYGLRVNNSVAGCGGFYNIESEGNTTAGFYVDSTSSKVEFSNVTGDTNGAFFIFHNVSSPVSLRSIKTETLSGATSGSNDPAILIQGTTQLQLEIDNAQIIGNTQGNANCTAEYKRSSSGGPINASCYWIQADTGASGFDIEGKNLNISNYAHDFCNKTSGSCVTTDFTGVGQIPDFYYNSKSGGVFMFAQDATNIAATGQNTIQNLQVGQALWGSITMKTLGTPSTIATCTQQGTTGATSLWYKTTAKDAAGNETAPSAFCTLSNANATLSSTNYVDLVLPLLQGSAKMCIYRSTDNVTYTQADCMPTVQLSTGNNNGEFYDYGQSYTGTAIPASTAATGGLAIGTPTGGLKISAVNAASGYYNNGNSAVEGSITYSSGYVGSTFSTAGSSLVVGCNKMLNAGKLTNLKCTSDVSGTCTTAPTFGTRDTTSSTNGTNTVACSNAAGQVDQGTPALSFAAGDSVCITRTVNPGTCTTSSFNVDAHWSEP